jgi:hypothetical protein
MKSRMYVAGALVVCTLTAFAGYAPHSYAESGEPPKHATGFFGFTSTSRPPCTFTGTTCPVSIVANNAVVVGAPAQSFCKDPGHTLLPSLTTDCVVQLSGSIPTRLACGLSDRVYSSAELRYKLSSGREFIFTAIVKMELGEVVFDGTVIDVANGTGAVHVHGLLTNLCADGDRQLPAYPPWGMTGRTQYVHVET